MEFSFGKPTDVKVSELLKQSTGFKKTDIEKSILLIKEAIELDSSLSHYIKLVNYLSISNKKDEVISTYNFLIEKYKSNNDFFNCRNRYQLYENYSKFLFKTRKYDEYIFYSCLSLFNELINLALIGIDEKTIKHVLDCLEKKEILTDSKTNKSFSLLQCSKNQLLFIETLYKILSSFSFIELSRFYHILEEKASYDLNIHKEYDWFLKKDNKFCEMIKLFDEDIFINLYRNNLEPLLK